MKIVVKTSFGKLAQASSRSLNNQLAVKFDLHKRKRDRLNLCNFGAFRFCTAEKSNLSVTQGI